LSSQVWDAYYIPEHVSPHVEIVTPSIRFDAILNKRDDATIPTNRTNVGDPEVGLHAKTTGTTATFTVATPIIELKNRDQMITPTCLRALWSFPSASICGKELYGSWCVDFFLLCFRHSF